jgi:hypothetical protein
VPAARQLQRVFAVAGLDALIVLEAQVQTDQLADVRFVFDNEDGRARRGRGFQRLSVALLDWHTPYSTLRP